MQKKITGLTLSALLLAVSFPATAQQSKKIPRIALLVSGSTSSHKYVVDASIRGLRDYGYRENVAIEYRYVEGKRERFPEIAAELVRLNPDIIIVARSTAARTMKAVTSTIPIVVGSGGDLYVTT